MDLTLDIEVIPNLDAAAIAEIEAAIQAPGNYKKPESIAEWMAENKQRLVDEAVHRACFAGETGRIVCIGWAFEDEPVKAAIGEEKSILAFLFDDIKRKNSQSQLSVIGHNVGWDIRYIWQRAVINGIKPPHSIKWQGKPWDHLDTMALWNPNPQGKISLDRLCKALGVKTSKGEMDGSMVWDYFKAGRIKEISEYCQADVVATRECWRRMTFAT